MLWYGIYLWFMAFECGSSLQSRSLRGVNGVKIDPIGWKMWFLIKRKDLKWIVFFSSYRRLRWSTKATPPTFTWAHQTEASYETYGSPRTATWMSSCFQEAWLTCSRARRAKRRHALKPKAIERVLIWEAVSIGNDSWLVLFDIAKSHTFRMTTSNSLNSLKENFRKLREGRKHETALRAVPMLWGDSLKGYQILLKNSRKHKKMIE